MLAALVWSAFSVTLVIVSAIVVFFWNRARRRAGEQVMTVFDRADASADVPSGWVRIMEDDVRGVRSLLRRNSNPAAERWRLAMWAVLALWLVNIAIGYDIARRVTGT
jgi:hypothetical protein